MRLELIGPCSDTGAVVSLYDTVATVDEYDRVAFHRVMGVENHGPGNFTVLVKGGERFPSTDIWLIYTKKRPLKLGTSLIILSDGPESEGQGCPN